MAPYTKKIVSELSFLRGKMVEQYDKPFCEEDIRPSRMMLDKQRYVQADREFLLARKCEWVQAACPSCESHDAEVYGQKLGFIYVECTCCRTVYTNPRPSQALMREFYARAHNYTYWNKYIFPATEDIRRKRIFRPRSKRVTEYCRQLDILGGALLEIGAGFGTFCDEIRKEGVFKRIIALEPTPDLAQTCRERGFEVLEMPLEQVCEERIVDVVAAFEVIEHVFSPRTFIIQCSRLLKDKGLLVLTCPNVRGFDTLTLKMLSNVFDHEHVNYFHTKSLPCLIERLGFQILDVQTPGKLDAELVRNQVVNNNLDLSAQPFLNEVLVERWEDAGGKFQEFLAANRLSSHMQVIARKL